MLDIFVKILTNFVQCAHSARKRGLMSDSLEDRLKSESTYPYGYASCIAT